MLLYWLKIIEIIMGGLQNVTRTKNSSLVDITKSKSLILILNMKSLIHVCISG